MEFPGGGDTYLTISDSSHPFLSGAETFHTPSLGDEEFEIPPISLPLESDPSLAVTDVGCHFDLSDPSTSQDNGFSSQFTSAPLELPMTLSQGVIDQSGALISTLSMELEQSVSAPCRQEPPLTMSISLGDTSRGLYTHSQLTTIDHTELSSQLGLTLGSNTMLSQTHSPEQCTSATPSPASSIQEEDLEDVRRMLTEKRAALEERERAVLEATKKTKGPKRKKRKDPNEPQKPVSAYALFFRDTQAAIKGQNPNATFGEVSKIVASMWDSLGEEQKQIYKRKTETAKKEYLKALASYRASLVSQPVSEASEPDAVQSVQQTLALTSLSPALLISSSCSSSSSPPAGGAGQASGPGPGPSPGPLCTSAPRVLVSCPAPVSVRPLPVVSSQGVLAVLPASAGVVGGGTAPAQALRLASPAPQLLQLQLPSAQLRLQPPPPLQPMPPPPLQAVSPRPPPLQAAGAQQKARVPIPQPPPLQVQIIQLQQLAPAPAPAQSTVGLAAIAPRPPAGPTLALLECPVSQPEESPQVVSPPQVDVELVTSSPPQPLEQGSDPQVCVRSGCRNLPVSSSDWDGEYCSSECVVSHCRDVFMAWVAARNPNNMTSVK